MNNSYVLYFSANIFALLLYFATFILQMVAVIESYVVI